MRLCISSMWNKGVQGWMPMTGPRKACTPVKREDSSSGIVDCVPCNCSSECGGYMTKSFKSFIHKHSRPIVDHTNSWVLEIQYNALTVTCIIVNVTGVKLKCRQALYKHYLEQWTMHLSLQVCLQRNYKKSVHFTDFLFILFLFSFPCIRQSSNMADLLDLNLYWLFTEEKKILV